MSGDDESRNRDLLAKFDRERRRPARNVDVEALRREIAVLTARIEALERWAVTGEQAQT